MQRTFSSCICGHAVAGQALCQALMQAGAPKRGTQREVRRRVPAPAKTGLGHKKSRGAVKKDSSGSSLPERGLAKVRRGTSRSGLAGCSAHQSKGDLCFGSPLLEGLGKPRSARMYPSLRKPKPLHTGSSPEGWRAVLC